MSEDSSTLYAKLLGETASITWQELQPFFARGALLRVASEADLIEAALAVTQDDRDTVAKWLANGQLAKLSYTRTLVLGSLPTEERWAEDARKNCMP